MLDPRGGANLTQEPNKYMANDVPIIPESDPLKAEVTGNNANIQPCTQDCPIDIIDSQHLNSGTPVLFNALLFVYIFSFLKCIFLILLPFCSVSNEESKAQV